MRRSLEDARRLAAVWLAQLSQLAVNNPSNGRISEGVVAQGRHHRVDGHCVFGMPSSVILGGRLLGQVDLEPLKHKHRFRFRVTRYDHGAAASRW